MSQAPCSQCHEVHPRCQLVRIVAIVTGSTQGLGTDIARQLLNAGASVMLVGRNRDAGAALASELGERCRFVACNVELDEDIDDCIDTTLAAFGRLDILVNNACVYDDQGLQSDREQWLNTLNINLVLAAIFVQKANPPDMKLVPYFAHCGCLADRRRVCDVFHPHQ